jgi:hypothetical protein
MFAGSTLLLLLLGTADDLRVAPARARAELDVCAARIEMLKAHGVGGAELDRLLRRAEELATLLEQAEEPPPVRAATTSAEELRERADAARDEADRLSAEIASIDVRLGDMRRSRAEPPGVERAVLGTAAPQTHDRVRTLLAERAALAERRARAQAEAARLDAEAKAADRDR